MRAAAPESFLWQDPAAVEASDASPESPPGGDAAAARVLLDLRVPSCGASLEDVRREVRGALQAFGCHDEFTETCILALNEAVTNVVRHGYGLGAEGEIGVAVAVAGNEGVFTVRDSAPAFDPAGADDSSFGELRPGGYGRPLMEAIMDSVRYRRDTAADANVFEMRKRLESAPAQERE